LKPGIYTVKYYVRQNTWKITHRKTTYLALDRPEFALLSSRNFHVVCRVDSAGPIPAYARAAPKIIEFIEAKRVR